MKKRNYIMIVCLAVMPCVLFYVCYGLSKKEGSLPEQYIGKDQILLKPVKKINNIYRHFLDFTRKY